MSQSPAAPPPAPESGWQRAVASEWASRRAAEAAAEAARGDRALFPLAANPFGEEEILAMTEVLLSGRLTLGDNVERAEREFAAAVGAPYAVMVNSGSSANLLMVSALFDSERPAASRLAAGDEVFVPAVCWSTSVAPLLQLGLVPVFVDADPTTFNMCLASLSAACSAHPRARALMAVHVLGGSSEMGPLLALARARGLILLEDTCESLGSRARLPGDAGAGAMLGTFGAFGAYSFYFSHHITCGEGGMVVCQTEADLNCLRRLRAHGWTRHLTNRAAVEAQHPDVDARFLFVSVGYNVRPMEVQGAMLRVQLRKLDAFNACRRDNLARIAAALGRDARFASRMALMAAAPGTDPAWFGVGVVLHRPYAHQLREYLAYLGRAGVENRPVISGNFVRQPMIAAALPHLRAADFPGAEVLHTRGFFIGVHQLPVADADIDALVRIMLGFDFVPRRVVLVTGAGGMLGRHIQEEVARLAAAAGGGKGGALPLTFGCGMTARGGVAPAAASPADGTPTEWVFAARADGDLTDPRAVDDLFKRYQPTHVLHLAARLASLQEMTAAPVDFWQANAAINNNVLGAAHKFQSWCGPIRVVSVLSTVMFPRDAVYPVGAAQAEAGSLHAAGEAYALGKRALAALTRWYRAQHGDDFVAVLPGNFFGPHGDFDPATAPLVNALIAKATAAADAAAAGAPAPALRVMGTGKPLRQLMHARDLARILLWALDYYAAPQAGGAAAAEALPLVVAGPEHSIRDIADMVRTAAGFAGELAFDTEAVDGPLRRTADTAAFDALCPDFVYAPLADSVRETAAWYRQSRGAK